MFNGNSHWIDTSRIKFLTGISQNVRNAVATADNEEVKTLLKVRKNFSMFRD